MVNFIVSIIVFGSLGTLLYRMLAARRKGGSSCHSGCGSCPFACERRKQD